MTDEEFVTLIHEELGVPVSTACLERSMDEVPGWDSMHLIWLVSAMEGRTGRRVSLPRVLEAPSLGAVNSLYADDAKEEI
jgi:hypothetical protein